MGDYVNSSLRFTCILKHNIKPFVREITTQPLSPLHETDAVSMEVFVETKLCDIVSSPEAVEIEVIKSDSPLVLVQEGKRGTRNGNRIVNPQAGCHPSDELGLATAKVTGKGNEAPRFHQLAKPLTQRDGFFDTMRTKGNHWRAI